MLLRLKSRLTTGVSVLLVTVLAVIGVAEQAHDHDSLLRLPGPAGGHVHGTCDDARSTAHHIERAELVRASQCLACLLRDSRRATSSLPLSTDRPELILAAPVPLEDSSSSAGSTSSPSSRAPPLA